mmetsp:Transcript_90375/g.179843  ORF Transcript_90375/g.179843 Transcript_90375/m.179843 type:complete len:91 (+) Transcript_90375:220-492(+)
MECATEHFSYRARIRCCHRIMGAVATSRLQSQKEAMGTVRKQVGRKLIMSTVTKTAMGTTPGTAAMAMQAMATTVATMHIMRPRWEPPLA